MTLKEAKEIIGRLGEPGKMPCHSYSIPAQRCKVGKKLAKVEGSVCRECYALKNHYQWGIVKDALERRFRALRNPKWTEAMIMVLGSLGGPYFRWHDSGDLQGLWHLKKIVQVAERLPMVKFWLPTREYSILRLWMARHGVFPPNLLVRVSGHLVDKPAPHLGGLPRSWVSTLSADVTCPAGRQGNKCLDCRNCWDPSVKDVVYHLH